MVIMVYKSLNLFKLGQCHIIDGDEDMGLKIKLETSCLAGELLKGLRKGKQDSV